MAELFRLGVSTETKNNILPLLDKSDFLGFKGEDRASLYIFAVAICAKNRLPSAKVSFESFVMDKSIKDLPTSILILEYLTTIKSLEKEVGKVGKGQRKGLVKDYLDPMSNAGFAILREMQKKPEDVVIAQLIREMDEMCCDLAKSYPDMGLSMEGLGPQCGATPLMEKC